MKTIRITASVLFIAFLFCGCMNQQTLHNLAVVEGMGIDKKDDALQVSVQTLNYAKGGNLDALNGNITINNSEEGSTLSEAISKLSKDLSRKLFFGQNKLTVFGEELAKSGIDKNLDYFLRSSDSRPDVILCVAKDEAGELLKSEENEALVPCDNMTKLLENGERSGMGAYVTVNEALARYFSQTADIYLPILEKEEKHVRFAGLALFDENKMVDTTNHEETFGILLMNGKIKDGLLNLQDAELGKVGVEVLSVKPKLSVQVQGDTVILHVDFKLKLMLDEVENGHASKMDQKTMQKIEQLAAQRVETLCQKSFDKMKASRCDAICLGEYLRRDDRAAYDRLKNNWGEVLASAQIQINSDCKITKINDNSIRE